jgi:hypothetical protein
MTDERDHRIGSIGCALFREARMDMNVGDHGETLGLADGPEIAEIPAIEMHDPAVKTMRIKIVVEHEIHDPPPLADLVAEKEGAALA